MAYFRWCLAQGLIPEAEVLTSHELASMLRETVLQACLQRTLQQANIHDDSVPPAKQLWDRSLQVLMFSISSRQHCSNELKPHILTSNPAPSLKPGLLC